MTAVIEKTAHQWLDDEIQHRTDQALAQADQDLPKLQLSHMKWVLPKLLRIVYQNTDQPVEVLAPLIRSILQEHAFATTGGDPCDCEQLDQSIDETVGVLVSVLEKVRVYCRQHPVAS